MKTFPTHLVETSVVKRFRKATGLDSPEIREALRDLGGDMYYEMRRLLAICLTVVETAVESGKYPGYLNGVPLTEEQRKNIRSLDEDLKKELRLLIEQKWSAMNNTQKVGAEKLR